MKIIYILLFTVLFVPTVPIYAQLDDILNKVEKEVEKQKKEEEKLKKEKEEKKRKEEEKKKKEEAEKLANMPDTSFESEYHRNHVGEIAFCKNKRPDLNSEIQFTDQFSNDDENITACVYLKTPVKYYPVFDVYSPGREVKPAYEREYFMKIFVDGSESSKPVYQYQTSKDNRNNSFWLDLKDAYDFYKLPDGNHTLKIEMWGGKPGAYSTSEAIAKGVFNFNKIDKEVIRGKFSEIPAGMSNVNLEQQALNVINDIASYEKWSERYTKAKITSNDWTIVRNEWTGIILSRKIYMVLYGVWPDGKCRYTEFSFFQDYDGRNYQNTLKYNAIGGMYRIECE